MKERIYSKGPNNGRFRQENSILPNYFGSVSGKSVESREERKVAHTVSSHNSYTLRSEAAGRKDPCGSVNMLCPCANTGL